MNREIELRQALIKESEMIFSPERERVIATAGFPIGSYAILMDENRCFEGIAVKPDYRKVSVDELVEFAARFA